MDILGVFYNFHVKLATFWLILLRPHASESSGNILVMGLFINLSRLIWTNLGTFLGRKTAKNAVFEVV